MDCFFCGATLPDGEPGEAKGVVAYDPWLGRLWRVCGACRHWTPVPFQDRWEAVESCERLARDEASVVLETEHLSLLRLRRGQMIRVRGAPRPELADWRYSSLLERFRPRRRGVLARLLALPEPPVGGYLGVDFQGGGVGVPTPWIGSPFIAHGAVLTGLFTSVPLATTCPSCGGPFVVEPAAFADVRLLVHAGSPSIAATCGFCRADGAVPLREARPTLRVALAIVNGRPGSSSVQDAVLPIDRLGGPAEFVERLARRSSGIGSMAARDRMALHISLDELAEAEALEAEWRRAEELAAIGDGELTDVPGFVAFLARVRREEGR